MLDIIKAKFSHVLPLFISTQTNAFLLFEKAEGTGNTFLYELYANIKWHWWFLPFASIYRLISYFTKQINLPILQRKAEMTGGVYVVPSSLDGRENDERCWYLLENRSASFHITFIRKLLYY